MEKDTVGTLFPQTQTSHTWTPSESPSTPLQGQWVTIPEHSLAESTTQLVDCNSKYICLATDAGVFTIGSNNSTLLSAEPKITWLAVSQASNTMVSIHEGTGALVTVLESEATEQIAEGAFSSAVWSIKDEVFLANESALTVLRSLSPKTVTEHDLGFPITNFTCTNDGKLLFVRPDNTIQMNNAATLDIMMSLSDLSISRVISFHTAAPDMRQILTVESESIGIRNVNSIKILANRIEHGSESTIVAIPGALIVSRPGSEVFSVIRVEGNRFTFVADFRVAEPILGITAKVVQNEVILVIVITKGHLQKHIVELGKLKQNLQETQGIPVSPDLTVTKDSTETTYTSYKRLDSICQKIENHIDSTLEKNFLAIIQRTNATFDLVKSTIGQQFQTIVVDAMNEAIREILGQLETNFDESLQELRTKTDYEAQRVREQHQYSRQMLETLVTISQKLSENLIEQIQQFNIAEKLCDKVAVDETPKTLEQQLTDYLQSGQYEAAILKVLSNPRHLIRILEYMDPYALTHSGTISNNTLVSLLEVLSSLATYSHTFLVEWIEAISIVVQVGRDDSVRVSDVMSRLSQWKGTGVERVEIVRKRLASKLS